MATLAPPSPPTSPPSNHMRRKSWARKVERCCCTTFAYFPLLFIYGLTTWAIYVEVRVAFLGSGFFWLACLKAALGVFLYVIANVSYTIAVFTSPGSPLDPREDLSITRARKGGGYEGLPMYETRDGDDGEAPAHANMTTVTAKSTGTQRYCKKCNTVKPDRTHHCSTCGRCVLKMDHHCPWLATCVGLRNYKPFLLFLIYTSLFCWLCFGVSAFWVWKAIFSSSHMQEEGLMVVHTILLAVLGGIIGLVLSGFTGWHIYLAVTGQTTIESLEKTRYLSPLRKSMERQFQADRNYIGQEGEPNREQSLLESLKETHVNALPGVLRPEEGEDSRSQSATPVQQPSGSSRDSPAEASLQRNYASLEQQREHDRYAAYLDELDSEKLPNAFDLGWKRNLVHILGREPMLRFLPVCNTSGDGWMWEVSPKWTAARAEVTRQREARDRQDAQVRNAQPMRTDFNRWILGQGFVNQAGYYPDHLANDDGERGGGSHLQMQPLDRRKAPPGATLGMQHDSDGVDSYDTSSDEDTQRRPQGVGPDAGTSTANWNDVPDDFLAPKRNVNRSQSRGRTKGD